jgi:hypothetical protein
MIISDLNYLESTSEDIFGGIGVNINSNFNLNKNVVANVNENFVKTVTTNLGGLNGNVAEVAGTADASGNNTFTSIIFGTQTEDNRSESLVNAISATR